jgi:hypothetical protein
MQGLKEMTPELTEALYKDLGREKFTTELGEIMGSISTA